MLAGVVYKLNSNTYSIFRGAAIWQAGGLKNLVLTGLGDWLPGFCLIVINQFRLGRPCSGKFMAASGSNVVFGNVYIDQLLTSLRNHPHFEKAAGVFCNDRSHSSCQKVCFRLRNQEPFGRLMRSSVRRNSNARLSVGPWSKNYNPLSAICYSTGIAQDVFDGSSRDELIDSSAALSDHRTLKLSSGSCYLPHPAKEATGGEDAHFICEDEQAIGVADGVGGWAEVGVDAGLFSRELMSNSVTAILEEPKGSIDPARVLERAHLAAKAKGSSTALIIALTDKGLQAINLGDSGFMVVRDGQTIFESPVQQHGFNCPYQLESGSGCNLPSSGQVFTVPVLKGDVIVAGTDGLFDNLFNNEVADAVVDAIRAGFDPQATGQKIAALALRRALDKKQPTPFSTAAQEAGYHYYGGKLDDITVIVSYVTSSANE